MAIIGEIIKKAIHLGDKVSTGKSPAEQQENTLLNLLEKAQNTAFGIYYGFENILKSKNPIERFKQEVPTFDYDDLHEKWWKRAIEGVEDITWPGKPDYFALSSGTTGNRKYIPVTDDMLDSIKKAGVQQILATSEFDLPASFFEKEILMLGSSINLKHEKHFKAGEISGISAKNIPFWFEDFYKPGKEIAAIDDWDERVQKIAENAPKWDIGSLSGIPSWIELMLKKVIEYHGLKNIHEIWPNLQVYTTGGVAFEPYRKNFEQLLERPLVYIDTYLASEGFFALQSRPDTDAMALLTDNGIFFEFVPFEPDQMLEDGKVIPFPKTVPIDKVETGVDYVLLISTVSGAWRYMIGDTVQFTDVERAEIKITGRTKHFLNVVGAQLSVDKMHQGLQKVESELNLTVSEFTVAAVQNEEGEYFHRWYLGIDKNPSDIQEEEVAAVLDEAFSANNKAYKTARGKALKGVEVNLINLAIFYDWTSEKKQKGGQVKFPRVMKAEQFQDWEDYVKKHNNS